MFKMKRYKFIKDSNATAVTIAVNNFLFANRHIISDIKFDWKADVGSYSYVFVCLEYTVEEKNVNRIID